MVEIQIIFGSNGGNTQLVCEYITDQLIELGHKVHLDRGEHFPASDLTQNDLLILACPTYEHGSLEPNFLKHFWPRIQEIDLQQHACVVIGLGDIKYDIITTLSPLAFCKLTLKPTMGVLCIQA